ncbi:dihydropteridine reductase-like [Lytechinus variegatus]|uniref:dihydropteridine reductase-like n=1 Tax=Lytechinus variegatus TaxID=7654 RepID=UPI001BB1B5F1|nr:dihydropteridine reductase-like [Lytechinus variegatus]
MAANSRVFVYGGKGALGSQLVNFYKSKNWWVLSADLAPNEQADANVIISELNVWTQQSEEVYSKVEEALSGQKLDAILCVAGGWAGGNAKSKDLVKNADLMFKQSCWTSVISAGVASRHLKEGGLLQLTGAFPALEGTAGMMGYGMAKAAVHQLTKGLGADNSGLPANATALAILPVTLDTPMNRKFMANADFSSWTTLEYVSELLYKWSQGEDRPASGSLVQLITKEGNTELVVC